MGKECGATREDNPLAARGREASLAGHFRRPVEVRLNGRDELVAVERLLELTLDAKLERQPVELLQGGNENDAGTAWSVTAPKLSKHDVTSRLGQHPVE